MSIIDKMISGLAGALAGLPQTNPQNHSRVASSFGAALGAPVQESVDALQSQMDALSARMDAVDGAAAAAAAANAATLAAAVAALNSRISSIPPPYVPSTCLSYRITNVSAISSPDTDVVYRYKGCDGAISQPITLFSSNSVTLCADGTPTILQGAANSQIDTLGTSTCPQPSGSGGTGASGGGTGAVGGGTGATGGGTGEGPAVTGTLPTATPIVTPPISTVPVSVSFGYNGLSGGSPLSGGTHPLLDGVELLIMRNGVILARAGTNQSATATVSVGDQITIVAGEPTVPWDSAIEMEWGAIQFWHWTVGGSIISVNNQETIIVPSSGLNAVAVYTTQ